MKVIRLFLLEELRVYKTKGINRKMVLICSKKKPIMLPLLASKTKK